MSTTTPDVPATEPTTTPTPAPAKTRARPVYTVYGSDANGILTPIGVNIDAANDIDAIRFVTQNTNATSGSFVAVPNRNLKIRTVTVENTPRVVIS